MWQSVEVTNSLLLAIFLLNVYLVHRVSLIQKLQFSVRTEISRISSTLEKNSSKNPLNERLESLQSMRFSPLRIVSKENEK